MPAHAKTPADAPDQAPAPRQCFWIPVEQFDEDGYIPSVVTEGEPGHLPLTGRGAHAQPWHWGKTYDEARETARLANAEKGISEMDAHEIVISSMRASGSLR